MADTRRGYTLDMPRYPDRTYHPRGFTSVISALGYNEARTEDDVEMSELPKYSDLFPAETHPTPKTSGQIAGWKRRCSNRVRGIWQFLMLLLVIGVSVTIIVGIWSTRSWALAAQE
ncbi:uncharacterized protein BJX67DRAFT_384741 [Aspergillus lucknowensis]|uniref:Uncharacterized protein n=1 Tax=Aspergillus lucknowensis TaxID=176173 RepID=A0ABR4LFV4_9EURO